MQKKFVFCIVIALIFNLLISCKAPAIGQTPIASGSDLTKPDSTVIYKTAGGQNLTIDFFYPTQRVYSKAPLVVAFHGGGWVSGTPDDMITGFPELITSLRAAGCMVAAVQYRLCDTKTVFPAPAQDCCDAIRWCEANAARYALDTGKFSVLGYSAGGNLALLAALAPDAFPSDSGYAYKNTKYTINACVSLAGPTVLYDGWSGTASDPALQQNGDYTATVNYINAYMGGTFARMPDQYKLASPYEQLAGAPRGLRLLFVAGLADQMVPPPQAEVMCHAAQQLGFDAQLIEVQNMTHNFTAYDSASPLSPTLNELWINIQNFIAGK